MRPALRKLSILISLAMLLVLSGCSDAMVLDPKGPIASAQKDLIWITIIICAVIAIPVFIMTFVIVWRYRDRANSKAEYQPDWEHNTKLEVTWWTIPIIAILILAIVTVNYTYKLEPSVALASDKEPIEIQVTSLDWKWLFTYPEENVATINHVVIPEDTPVRFKLTSDMAMNSFWIPSLGGQLYSMSGMAMTLYLQADEPGTYYGSGANFTGEYFAHMTFTVDAVSDAEYDAWVNEVKANNGPLEQEKIDELLAQNVQEVQYFSSFPENLFYDIVTMYVEEGAHNPHAGHTGEGSQDDQSTDDQDHADHSQHVNN